MAPKNAAAKKAVGNSSSTAKNNTASKPRQSPSSSEDDTISDSIRPRRSPRSIQTGVSLDASKIKSRGEIPDAKPAAKRPQLSPSSEDEDDDSDDDTTKDNRSEHSSSQRYRVLKRIVPKQHEGTLEEQVRKEFADQLVCDEPLDTNGGHVKTNIAKFNKAFEERFLELLVFYKAYGHMHVPKIYPDNPALGRWVVKVRAWKKRHDVHLTRSRLRRLNAIGFLWDPKAEPDFWKIQSSHSKAEDLWEVNFQNLLEYKRVHGDCFVPKEFAEQMRLARWVTKQRKHYKAKQNGEYHALDDDKEKRLIDIGFCFNTRKKNVMRESVLKRYVDRWNLFIGKLQEFKDEFGHCVVPRRWKRDQELASWVMRQRYQYRKLKNGKDSYLTPDRIQQLTEMGFVFADIKRSEYPLATSGEGKAAPEASGRKSSRKAAKNSANDKADDKRGGTKRKIILRRKLPRSAETTKVVLTAKTVGTESDSDSSGDAAPAKDLMAQKKTTATNPRNAKRKISPTSTEAYVAKDDAKVEQTQESSKKKTPTAPSRKRTKRETPAGTKQSDYGSSKVDDVELPAIISNDKGEAESEESEPLPDDSDPEAEVVEPAAGKDVEAVAEDIVAAGKGVSEGAVTCEKFTAVDNDKWNDADQATTSTAEAQPVASNFETASKSETTVSENSESDSDEKKPAAKSKNAPETPWTMSEPAVDVTSATRQRKWACRICKKDEFPNFVAYCAHEANCAGKILLSIPVTTQLE